jgi:hypothetical protein
MKKIVKAGNLCLLIIGAILVLSVAIAPSARAGPADVEFYFDPNPAQFAGDTPVGTRFNVTVMWKDNGDTLNHIFAWQVSLQYDPTLLNCTQALQPTWDSDYVFYGMAPLLTPPSGDVGYMLIMDALQGKVYATGALKKLVVFEMEIMSVPSGGASSSLHINGTDTMWSPTGKLWYQAAYTDTPSDFTATDGLYTIPELSIVVMTLALLATSTAVVVLRRKKERTA